MELHFSRRDENFMRMFHTNFFQLHRDQLEDLQKKVQEVLELKV